MSLKLHCYKIIPNNLSPPRTFTLILLISVIMNHMILIAPLITCLFILMSNWQPFFPLCCCLLFSITSSRQPCVSFLSPSGASSLLTLPFMSYHMHRGLHLELQHSPPLNHAFIASLTTKDVLIPCDSKGGPGTSNISITENFLETQHVGPLPRPAARESAFSQDPQVIHVRTEVWEALSNSMEAFWTEEPNDLH